jgi:hypothetical protein
LNGQPLPSALPQPTSDYRTSAPRRSRPFRAGRRRAAQADRRAGGFCDITLEPVPGRIESATTWRMSSRSSPHLTSPGPCFAGKPEDKVAAAVDAIREALRPHVGPDGVVMDATAWLVLAHR